MRAHSPAAEFSHLWQSVNICEDRSHFVSSDVSRFCRQLFRLYGSCGIMAEVPHESAASHDDAIGDLLGNEIRIKAEDGKEYTYDQFIEYYGEVDGPLIWEDRAGRLAHAHRLECELARRREDAYEQWRRDCAQEQLEAKWNQLEADADSTYETDNPGTDSMLRITLGCEPTQPEI